MPLEMIPHNREIIAILDAHVQGQYRFVHDARLPYVRIGPAHETAPITIRAAATLKLLGHGSTTKRLQGLGSTVDFGVIDDDGPIRLGEVPWRIAALDHLDLVHRVPSKPIEHLTRARPPSRAPTRQQAVLHPSLKPVPASTPDVSIPEHLHDVCTREDLHPELGDYLVVPRMSHLAFKVVPTWVVKSDYVEQVHVVKPRIGVDKPITQEP